MMHFSVQHSKVPCLKSRCTQRETGTWCRNSLTELNLDFECPFSVPTLMCIPRVSWQNRNSVCLQMLEGAWRARGQKLILRVFGCFIVFEFVH